MDSGAPWAGTPLTPPRAGPDIGARRAEALGARLPPLLVAAERVAATVAQGVHGRRRVGQGDSFWQFRRFVTGDAIGRIDWRQSAKSGRAVPEGWFVRETEWEAAQTVCLWRDGSASMHWRSRQATVEKRDRASILLLALASLLLRGGERVALLQEGARPVAGRRGLDRLAADLTAPDLNTSDLNASNPAIADPAGADEAGGLPPRLPIPRHGTVVLFGDFLSPLEEVQALLARMSSIPANGYLLQVLDPAEALLPYAGRIRFRGLERDGETLIPRVESVREAYAAKLKAQQDGLAALCSAAGFGFGIHRTDHPPETALLALYAALGVR